MEQALQLFHEGHPGSSRMKSLARSYIWWSGMDSAIEDKVKQCHTCQENRNDPSPILYLERITDQKKHQTFQLWTVAFISGNDSTMSPD